MLSNRIALNQLPDARAAVRLAGGDLAYPCAQPLNCTNVWGRALSASSYAVAFVNNAAAAQKISCDAKCLQQLLGEKEAASFTIRDLWAKKDVGTLAAGAALEMVVPGEGGVRLLTLRRLSAAMHPVPRSAGKTDDTARPPYLQEPYPVFWAVAGPNTTAFGSGGEVDVAQYGIKANNWSRCGDLTGFWPTLNMTTMEPASNGGVPQAASLSLFLSHLRTLVEASIPDPDWNGLGIFE